MKKLLFLTCAAWAACAVSAALQPFAFELLPPGAVRPAGWLRHQLELQRDGLTGHAEELYDDIGQADWVTGGHRGGQFAWERGPYYAKGLIPLAWALDDANLKAKSQKWVDNVIASQRTDGNFGPNQQNWWANMIVLHYLRDVYLATQDARILDFFQKYFDFQLKRLPELPLRRDSVWAMDRGGDNLDVVLWLYDRTQNPNLLKLADLLVEQTSDWSQYYADGSGEQAYPVHIVNTTQGLKAPALMWRVTGRPLDRDGYRAFVAPSGWIMRQFGRADGMVNGTEPMTDRATTQGTELCAVAERILSAVTTLGVLGEAWLGDDLEYTAYNALPAEISPDGRGIRYYLLQNEPKCTNQPLGFSDNGNARSICPGPDAGFPCCRSNYHFAWPKFVQNMWMKAPDGGLVAAAYGPNTVTAPVGPDQKPATLAVGGNYPFGDHVTVTVQTAPGGRFPLHLRIPSWAENPEVKVNGAVQTAVKTGSFLKLERDWKAGDVVSLAFPAAITYIRGLNASVAVRRGPLLYALKLAEKPWKQIDMRNGFGTYEILPDAPWNWALLFTDPAHALDVAWEPPTGEIPDQPFKWNAAPCAIKVKGFLTTAGRWGRYRTEFSARAFEPPASPIPAQDAVQEVTLVPYGATQIRITLFPWALAK